MGRRQVAVADLPSYFKSLIKKQVEPVRREAEDLCKKAQDWMDEIKNTGTKLLKENVDEVGEEISKSSISSADKFGQKIIDLVDAVKMPSEMTYNALVDYTNTLRNFQSQIVNAGKIWIPRLPLKLKRTIRELEAKMRLLGHSIGSLENHVSDKHRQLDRLERITEDSESLCNLHKELQDLDSSIMLCEDEALKLDAENSEIDKSIKQLELSEVSKKIAEEENQLQNLRSQISEIFQPLQKPIEKILKTSDSKKGLVTSESLAILQHYVNDPVDAVQGEQMGFARLRSALEALRNVLGAGGIDLKESRIRNALKTISEICSSMNLETLRESYAQLQLQHHASLSSKEAISMAEKRRDLENRRQKVINERSRLDLDIQDLRTRRRELSLRVARLKVDLEERIESTGEGALEIVLDN